MSENHSTEAANSTPPNKRKFDRKRVPLKAMLIETNGETLCDCTVQDLSLVGAKIELPDALPISEKVYLIDLRNRIAYDADVAWWRPHAAGLAFQKSFKLNEDLPVPLRNLKMLLIEATLEEIGVLTADGLSLAEAVVTVGITGAMYARWSAECGNDDELASRLWEQEEEIEALHRLLIAKKPYSVQ